MALFLTGWGPSARVAERREHALLSCLCGLNAPENFQLVVCDGRDHDPSRAYGSGRHSGFAGGNATCRRGHGAGIVRDHDSRRRIAGRMFGPSAESAAPLASEAGTECIASNAKAS